MNERINQLLSQAYDQGVPETWTTLSSEQLGRIYDKFAELIVRECADIALNHPAKLPSNAWKGVDVPSDTSDRIKRHFGIEK